MFNLHVQAFLTGTELPNVFILVDILIPYDTHTDTVVILRATSQADGTRGEENLSLAVAELKRVRAYRIVTAYIARDQLFRTKAAA
jgi:hypothetical protein